MKVTYTSAIPDLSGYATAARGNIRSLCAVGIDVSVDPMTFEVDVPERVKSAIVTPELQQLIAHHSGGSQFQIVHLTPDLYRNYAGLPGYKIGYYAWETTRLPANWVTGINDHMNEAWVPSDYLKEVSLESGVKVPVRVFPHAIPEPPPKEPITYPIEQARFDGDRFVFYSIFQWSTRKNPQALITAYAQEFGPDERVSLVMKTYMTHTHRDENGTEQVQREVDEIANKACAILGSGRPPNPPKIFVICDTLTKDEIFSMHHQGDCYVTMARSEAFCLPVFEAAAVGNPVIAPYYSAFKQYLNADRAYLVQVHRELMTKNMGHISGCYDNTMSWGDPDIDDCRRLMREAFSDQETAKAKGLAGQKYVKENFSHAAVGSMMRRRLERILNGEG